MRKMPRGSSSITPPSSSGALSSTWKPLASSPFAVRRKISESSLSRPGECASSRKMPQQYGSLTLSLLLGRAPIRAHLLRCRARPHAPRTGSTPRVRPSRGASQLDPSRRPPMSTPHSHLLVAARVRTLHVQKVRLGCSPCATSRRWTLLADFALQSRRMASGEGFGERYVLGPVHVHHRLDHLAVHRLARLEEPLQVLA